MRGSQHPGPEWMAVCGALRLELLKVCPLGNRKFAQAPGTFRRQHVSVLSGVALHNIARLLDQQKPVSPETVVRLARFLGLICTLKRVGPLPVPGGELEERKLLSRAARGLPPRTRRRTDQSRSKASTGAGRRRARRRGG